MYVMYVQSDTVIPQIINWQFGLSCEGMMDPRSLVVKRVGDGASNHDHTLQTVKARLLMW